MVVRRWNLVLVSTMWALGAAFAANTVRGPFEEGSGVTSNDADRGTVDPRLDAQAVGGIGSTPGPGIPPPTGMTGKRSSKALAQTDPPPLGGSPARLTLIPVDGALHFPYAEPGQVVTKVIRVQHRGSVPASSVSFTPLAGPIRFAGGIYPGNGGDCGATIAADCSLVLSFAPLSSAHSGTRASLGAQYGNGVDTAFTNLLRLTGWVETNQMPYPQDFGRVAVGTSRTLVVTVTGLGLPIESFTLAPLPAPFAYLGGSFPGTGGACHPGLTVCYLALTCAPTLPGSFFYYVPFELVEPGSVYTDELVLRAEAFDAIVIDSAPGSTHVEFGPTLLDLTDVARVRLGFVEPTVVTSMTIPAGPFSFAGGAFPGTGGDCGTPALACTVVLSFAPPSLGVHSAHAAIETAVGGWPERATLLLSGEGHEPEPARHLLVLANASSAESQSLAQYYLDHRPGVAAAAQNLVYVTTTTAESFSEAEYLAQIQTPVIDWVRAHADRDIRYVVLMPDLPLRISGPHGGSVAERLARLSPERIALGRLPQWYDSFLAQGPRLGKHWMVTSLEMDNADATRAYIDKLAAQGGGVLISGGAASAGSTYFFEDAGGYAGVPIAGGIRDALLAADPTAQVEYRARTDAHFGAIADVAGFATWGVNGGVGSEYALDGTFRFSGGSAWYLIQTFESFNGQLASFQGNFRRWFAASAFGGVAYSNTPAGAVAHVDEPYTSGLSSPDYFVLWQQGRLFSQAAWGGHRTPHLLPIGDPLVRR